VPALSKAEVPALSEAEVPALSEAEVPALSEAEVPALSEAEVPALSEAEVSKVEVLALSVVEVSEAEAPASGRTARKTGDRGSASMASISAENISTVPSGQSVKRIRSHSGLSAAVARRIVTWPISTPAL
jgi:hypothetical protein